MTLIARDKLGPYEILSPLGAGGMGEVYRARDTRLDRDVAIKVLPDSMARDKERLLRFEREAKVLATLNHPNIAAIYGFEEFDGKRLLVMELAEGETLAERLKRGPLSTTDALELGCGIAIALEAAHEKGIIHRDLKPANVKVGADGQVKVLDFGLAKAVSDDASSTDIANSPTITLEHTRPGVILGTAAYMSPEQARGRALDKRTDIWSFGCVLFECLAGRRPFQGETATDLIAKILEGEPNWTLLPANLPPAIHSVVRRCLAKDRSKRLRDIGDVRLELESALSEREWSSARPAGRAASRSTPRAALFVAVALVAAGLYGAWLLGQSRPQQTAVKIAGSLTRVTDVLGQEHSASLAPDGKSVVYVAPHGGDLDIFSLRVGGLNPTNLTADCDGDDNQPAFSPDGTRIVFRSERDGGGLFIMGEMGESPRRLTDFGFDPQWSPDSRSVVFCTEGILDPLSRGTIASIWTIDVATGEKRKLSDDDAVQPSWSPDGRRIAYWRVYLKGGQRDLFTIPSTGGEPVAITDDPATDWNPIWSPNGQHLYFTSDRGGTMNIWRIPIDQATGQTLGEPEPVTASAAGCIHPSLSADGRLLTFTSMMQTANVERVPFDPTAAAVTGAPEPVTRFTRPFGYTSVSPDGAWVAAISGEGQEDLFLVRKDGSERRQLTNDRYKDRGPAWSPDGSRLAFYSDRTGKWEIWIIHTDGSNLRQISRSPTKSVVFPVWSPDGNRLLFSTEGSFVIVDPDRSWDEQTPEAVSLQAESREFSASAWSRDGQWLVGVENESKSDSKMVLYSFEAKEFQRTIRRGEWACFLDDGRVVFLQDSSRLLLDGGDGVPPKVLLDVTPDHIDNNGFGLPRDQSAIYYTRIRTESDVWLMRLE